MPVVNISWLKGRDRETKERIAGKIEKIMQEDGKCAAGDTYVVFNDYEKEDWAIKGKLMDN